MYTLDNYTKMAHSSHTPRQASEPNSTTQKHKRRSRQDIKRIKWSEYDVCHDAAATPISAQPNEREQQTGARNGTSVNLKKGGVDDDNVQ